MTDPKDQVEAVHRRLGLQERAGREGRVVVASQTYDTGIDDVWDAITTAERIPRWFLPVSGDLRPGGRYRLEGNAGGTVLECEPPRHLAVTWEYGGEVTWVEVRLSSDSPGRTTLELRHAGHVDHDRWREFGAGAVGIGWDMALLGLSTHLSGGAGVRPEDAMTWSTSDEGRRFMTSSGRKWLAASIAAGEDEASATAAADRCIAAYTGAAPQEAPDPAP